MRKPNVRLTSFLGTASALVLLAGCGGGGGGGSSNGGGTPDPNGRVAGIVVDESNNPVPGAVVSIVGTSRTATSDSAGRFSLFVLTSNGVVVKATIGGYTAYSAARVYNNFTTRNVALALHSTANLATLSGSVTDSTGAPVAYAQISARPTDGSIKASTIAIANASGQYTLQGLRSGTAYRISASKQDSTSQTSGTFVVDSKTVTGTETGYAIVLPATSGLTTADPGPTVLSLKAVTSNADNVSPSLVSAKALLTTGQREAAYESLKRLRNPGLATPSGIAKPRVATNDGNSIEIDLTWNDYTTPGGGRPYGFAIYRSDVTNGPNQLADPLAVSFYDSARELVETKNYTYSVAALSADFTFDKNGANTGGQSAKSAGLTVQPLGGLDLSNVVGRTVSWTGVTGVAGYTVYVYSALPAPGVSPVYTSPLVVGSNNYTVPSSATPAAAVTESNPNGTKTYFVIVVGARTATTGSNGESIGAETYSDLSPLSVDTSTTP